MNTPEIHDPRHENKYLVLACTGLLNISLPLKILHKNNSKE